MNTLVIYDESGAVVATMTGNYPDLIGTAVIEVPEGYEVSGVNTETGEVILAPKPATEAERTAAIEAQMMAQTGEHAGSYEDPVPFVYGMPVKKGRYYSFGSEKYIWNGADSASCVWLPTQGIWEWGKAGDPSAEGTEEDPIPAARGMEYIYGKCYLDPEDDGIYRCQRAGEAEGGKVVLQHLPHELAGHYFEVV